ncbi:hypothetical protein QM281_17765, partial [Acinetobacter baumannii]|uniref:hypothetical protein n=1 Tax=Acinetobacter baumannii TaxID=470 RepID=UPI0024B7B047
VTMPRLSRNGRSRSAGTARELPLRPRLPAGRSRHGATGSLLRTSTGGTTMIPKRRPGVRYEVNVCGGGFDSVKSHFDTWKHEPLIYRPERRMFEGKADVRPLGVETFGATEPTRLVHVSYTDFSM